MLALDMQTGRIAVQSIKEQMQIIKAKGGWKHRQEIKLSDQELLERLPKAESELLLLAIHAAVAERMLREPPPSIHPRTDEYAQRVEDVLNKLIAEGLCNVGG